MNEHHTEILIHSMNTCSQAGQVLAATPLLGRLAFASVFLILIAWLLWIPTEKLQDFTGTGTDSAGKRPPVAFVRYSAVAIATIQVLLYLFWA